jgi:hypothetical protein
VAQLSETFTVREDRSDGLDMRTVCYRGEPVLARVYFAVRDVWWRTVPLTIRERRRQSTPTGFAVLVEAATAWESHPMDVRLRYVVSGPDVTAEVAATAGGSFTYGRIGFCLLFPMDGYRGHPARSWRSGVPTDFAFPDTIITRDHADPASARFHRPFDRLETTLPSGTRVRYDFQGEEFEFEDQRNWTDPSFKAYSAPPVGGSPSATSEGRTFTQRVRVTVDADASAGNGAHRVRPGRDADVHLGAPVGTVPPIVLYRGRMSPRSYRPGGGFYELNSATSRGARLVGQPLGARLVGQPRAARLPAHDSIELGVNGAVHAADDESVLETTALHGVLVEQSRAAHPGIPVRLAPVTFLDVAGDWRDGAGRYSAGPPPGPLPARLLGSLAATWAVASAARALPAGPDALAYFDGSLPADTHAARTVARLGALAGGRVLAVRAPAPLAVLAVEHDGGVTLAVANPGPDPVHFRLSDGREESMEGFASAWYSLRGDSPAAIQPAGGGEAA